MARLVERLGGEKTCQNSFMGIYDKKKFMGLLSPRGGGGGLDIDFFRLP